MVGRLTRLRSLNNMSTTTKIPKLSTLIKGRKFDWVDSDITDTLFETPKEIGTDFRLFHFNRYISSDDAIKEMEKEGYRPANAWELLEWKDANEYDSVITLGSVGLVEGIQHVVVLRRVGAWQLLGLISRVGAWGAHGRFLAVRNSSLGTSKSEPTHRCPECNASITITLS